MIVVSVVASGVLLAALTYAAARRWPEPVETPHVAATTIVAATQGSPRFTRIMRQRTNPAEITGLALTAAVLAIVAGVAGIGGLLAMIHSNSGLARWDLTFTRFGATHATAGSTSFLRDISQLGGTLGVIVVGSIVAVIEYNRSRALSVIAFLTLAIAGQFALTNAVKAVVVRQRPPAQYHLTGFSGSSFPSGHATAAAATFMACALLLGRRRPARTKAILAAIAAGIAGAVASTRVLLGVHWFTDVLAGLLLGWGWFALCSIAFGGRLLHFGAPAEQAQALAAGAARSAPEP